jgi:cell wall-associated NlpC family hydrolase
VSRRGGSLLDARITGLAIALAAALTSAPRLSAQAFEGQVGHFFESDGWTTYRLGLSRPVGSVFGLALHGDYLGRTDGADGGFAGVGADVSAFRGGRPGPYVVAGLDAGMGSPHSNSFSSIWASWSAGVGYELFPMSFVALGAEARWRAMTLDSREGAEIAAGLTIRFGGKRHPPPPVAPGAISRPSGSRDPSGLPGVGPPQPSARGAGPARLADSVVATASEAMGRPYRFGGTGADGGGFDCSGLIQYAYGSVGVTLPRRSVDQAREGREVPRNPAMLLPGDVLTFSNTGGPVTHVGLYVGKRRFIHSATRGVQVSTLSEDDPYGRWWYRRWVGVRRILQQ